MLHTRYAGQLLTNVALFWAWSISNCGYSSLADSIPPKRRELFNESQLPVKQRPPSTDCTITRLFCARERQLTTALLRLSFEISTGQHMSVTPRKGPSSMLYHCNILKEGVRHPWVRTLEWLKEARFDELRRAATPAHCTAPAYVGGESVCYSPRGDITELQSEKPLKSPLNRLSPLFFYLQAH